MSAWDAYPQNYRGSEVQAMLSAVRAGECVSVIGLSGAGKSNLVGFMASRFNTGGPAFVLVDGNHIQPPAAEGLLSLIAQCLDDEVPSTVPGGAGLLEQAAARRLRTSAGGLCLLIDRFDALPADERSRAAGPLRALRDRFKYQLTYIFTTRRPFDPGSELAELFYANTIWLGPLAAADARWSAAQYAARRGQTWDPTTIARLVELSWGYPALLRACCEAFAAGAALDESSLLAHPIVQRRVQEFWADQPTPDDLRRSGLKGQPLLQAAAPPVLAASPDLTASEHKLLAFFQSHPGEVCPKDDLMRAVWPEDKVIDGLRDDSLAQLILRLRQKVGAGRIQTIPRRGYRYDAG